MHPTCSPRTALAVPILIVLAFAGPLAAQATLGEPGRDEWQRAPDVFEALALKTGGVIADVMAGDGYFADRLSLAVGPEGRVFAVETHGGAVRKLQEWLKLVGRQNVEVVPAEPNDPRLPDDTLDAALIADSYHDMVDHRAMLVGIRRALHQGGRLVIVDRTPSDSMAPREHQMSRDEIAIELVATDVERSGLRVLERRPDFITRESRRGRTYRYWMLIAERPVIQRR